MQNRDYYTVGSPRKWTLQSSDDNANWVVRHTVNTDTTNVQAAWKGKATFQAVRARYWRIVVTEAYPGNSNDCVFIAELALYI